MAAGYRTSVEGAGDPSAGRHTVWIVGALGVAAVVAYGTYQVQRRNQSTASVAVPTQPSEPPPEVEPIERLLARVESARRSLDVAALADLEGELDDAEGRAMTKAQGHEIRLTEAEAMATRALEAAIRAGTVAADGARAREVAAEATTRVRALLDAVPEAQVDPARVLAIRARLTLAEGKDVTAEHPMVLLPDYHDAEVRVAALARPLWTEAEVDTEELEDLIAAMRQEQPQTALTRLLLALALHWRGDDAGATEALDAVLAEVPTQPLAKGLRARMTQVAVAAPADDEPQTAPEVDDAAQAEPEPAAIVAPQPDAKAEPARSRSRSRSRSKSKSKSKSSKPTQPAASSNFDDLLAEGCKLARGGNARRGFDLLKKAHDLRPGGAKVTFCMAQAQAKLGNTASARALVDRVLRKQPRNKSALLLAAKLDAKSGNKPGALRLYRRVLAIDANNRTAKSFVQEHG